MWGRKYQEKSMQEWKGVKKFITPDASMKWELSSYVILLWLSLSLSLKWNDFLPYNIWVKGETDV